MKKILLLLSASALLWSCDQGKKARIDGTFSGLSHDTVLLEMVTTQQRTVVDSTVTSRQGDFSFRVELPVAAPTFFNLLCNGSVIPLIVSPGEKIAVNSLCDLSHNYTIEGSPDSEILMEFNRFYDRSVATLDSLSRLYAATPADAAHEARRKEILDRYTQDYLRIKREHINFIVSNASSMASIYALYQRLPNDPSLFNPQSDIVYYRIVADSLGRRYPDSPHVAALNKDIERQQTALNMVEEINRKAESPQSYPEIELEDLFGKTQKLTEKNGRVKYARFFMFDTKEELPFEVQYLTAADELNFYSNVNAFLKDLTTGEYITKLTQLKRLTIAAYGLVSLDKNFTALKNLEFLDLSSNNFQKIPDEINPTNFPKLRTLLMGANTRRNIYDLSNTVETNYGGLVDEEGFPRRMIEWDLDTLVREGLVLSVNYLQGPLPKMDDWEKYTEQDIIDADTLPRALIGTPKVMPHTKRFAINLNRLTGELPDWLLYHPALDWWSPFQLVFTQEGKDATGASAGFGNEPANLNYYYEFYEGYKKDPGAEEEDEDTTK